MRLVRPVLLAALLLLLAWVLGAAGPALAAEAPGPAPAGSGPVWVIRLHGTINPGSAHYLERALTDANADAASLVVLELDTPGGLVDSMRAMVRAILASNAPVCVYVAPAGARAASAGAFLVLAGQVAAMSPASNLGAAHPVSGGGGDIKGDMAEKAVQDLAAMIASLAKQHGRDAALARSMVTKSRSFDAAQAEEKGLVDLLAPDLGHLLTSLQGKVVTTAAGRRVINTAGKTLHFVEPSTRDKLISLLADPNLAYILLMIGLMGLYFELSTPGAVFPGVIGGLALLLALFAMSALPVSYTGLALIGLSVVLFIAEIKIISHGLLSLAGAASLVLGSVMLFDEPGRLVAVSLVVLVPTVATVMAFFVVVTWLAMRAQLSRGATGAEGLVGRSGVMVSAGKARVLGELWNVKGPEGLAPGEPVRVTKLEGLTLTVERAGDGE